MTIKFVHTFAEVRTPRQQREDVIAKVAKKHGFTMAELYSRTRTKPLAYARFEAWECLHAMGYSTQRIGRFFDRDHSTIISGLKRRRALAQQEAA